MEEEKNPNLSESDISPAEQPSLTEESAEAQQSDSETEACDEQEALQEETVEPVSKQPAMHEEASKAAGGILIRKSYLILAAFAVTALVVGSLFLGMWIKDSRSSNADIDPNAKDYHSIYANAGAASDQISVPGYSEVVFPADTRSVQIVLLNPEGNPCYFRFTLVLKDTEEVLYQSGLVPPGMAVTDITLSRALGAGSYSLEIQIESLSLEDRSAMNGANVETVLNVR